MASNKRCRYLSSAYEQQTAWPTSTYISAQWLKHPNEKLTFLCNFHSAQSPVVFLQSHLWWVSVIDNIHCSLVHHLTLQTEPAPCTRAKRQALRLEQYAVLQTTMHSMSIQGQKSEKTKVHKNTFNLSRPGRHCSQSEMTLTALPVYKNSIE